MNDILARILETKKQEIRVAQGLISSGEILKEALHANRDPAKQARGFAQALIDSIAKGKPGIIAEIKKASPSKGILRAQFHPKEIAQSYAEHGATCLSVLTDKDYFMGSPEFLKEARAACTLPVIRKDFIIDPYQVYEARAMGADAILLIVAALESTQMKELELCAIENHLDVLVEVHDERELEIALSAQATMIGVNQRNLVTFQVDHERAVRMGGVIPPGVVRVAESGVRGPDDAQSLRDAGYDAVLVGETLMLASDPAESLRSLRCA